jgi:uncharacterized lipoprotein YmbA
MKKILSRIAIIGFALAAAGCASTNPSIEYYLLNSEAIETNNIDSNAAAKLLLVEPVVLTDFLNQKYLVMQKSNTLYIAQTHQWAEPPRHSITAAISQSLRADLPQWRVSQSRYNPGEKSSHRLLVVVDKFHSTDQSTVVLQGSYQLRDIDGKLLTEQYFALSQDLVEDGFAQSVNQLRDLISELAQDIASKLEA